MKPRKLTASTGEYQVFQNFWKFCQTYCDFNNGKTATADEWDLILDAMNRFVEEQPEPYQRLAISMIIAWSDWLAYKDKVGNGRADEFKPWKYKIVENKEQK